MPAPRARALGLLSSLILCCGVGPLAAAAEEGLRAGAATSNITPPLGGGIVGGFAPVPSRHIHDELHARCLVLDDGQTQLALVICDLLGVHRSVCDAARAQIEQRLGIPAANVLISATHTHSALSALGGERYRQTQQLDDYQQFVVTRIVDGVQRAQYLRRPAELAYGTVEAPEHVFNRRWFLKPGTMPPNPFGEFDQVKMNPGAGSPNLDRPAGPTDPTISFLSVREPGGRPIALYAAYSLHYVGGVGPGHVSADYFGMFCDALVRRAEAVGQDPPFVPMLVNGTSGDINNINFLSPRPRQQPYEQMRIVAEDVAAKVHGALGSLGYRRDVPLSARFREVEVAVRRPTPEQLAWAQSKLSEPAPPEGKVDLPRVYADRVLRLSKETEETALLPVQVLRVGDVALGTMPCEVFCEIGLEFRARLKPRPAFLVELAHGYYGYLPTPEQHRLGGYETWLGTNRLEVRASEKLLDALVEMSRP